MEARKARPSGRGIRWAAWALAAAVLAGCGGGGGGSGLRPDSEPAAGMMVESPTSQDPPPEGGGMPESDPTQTTPEPVAEPTFLDAVRTAALSPPVEGSLHQSSLGHGEAPLAASDFVLEEPHHTYDGALIHGQPDQRQTMHYWDETWSVDYDGDGVPDRVLTVAKDSYVKEGYSERGICSVGNGVTGGCSALLGDPDGFYMSVASGWIDAGTIQGHAHPRHEVVRGWWTDRERQAAGVFWSGETIDSPRPLDAPIHGSARFAAAGNVFLPDGALVQAQAPGRVRFDTWSNTVRMDLGLPEQAHHKRGIALLNLDELRANPERWDIETSFIDAVFVFEEEYDPDSHSFGLDTTDGLRENDITSGNAKGQFGGVITTTPRPDSVSFKGNHAAPAVFGTVGLTDIESEDDANWDGVSLLMTWDASFDCVACVDYVSQEREHEWRQQLALFLVRHRDELEALATAKAGQDAMADLTEWGAWVDRGGINAFSAWGVDDGGRHRSFEAHYAWSLGSPSDSRPEVDMTWTGDMRAVRLGRPYWDIEGTATLQFDASDYTVDLSVTDSGWYFREPFGWNDMVLSAEGRFAQGAGTDSRVEGSLYGPQHEEAGGMFVHEGFVGAFGLSRNP